MPTKVFTTFITPCPFGKLVTIDSPACRSCEHFYRTGTGTFFWCNAGSASVPKTPASVPKTRKTVPKANKDVPKTKKRGRKPGKADKKPVNRTKTKK